jgi:Domain of unknown function (DUF222)
MEELAAPETLTDMYGHMIAQRDWLARLPVDTMTGFQATEVLEFGAKLERLGVAIQMVTAPKVSDTYVWKQEGHKTAASYLAEKTGTSEAKAGGALETARQLAELPETALCLAGGSFSPEQIKEIASAAAVHPEAEGELIEAAARSGLKGLKLRCQRTKALASFEMGEQARERAIHQSRFFRHRFDPDGAVRIEARLTPADGARILEAVKAKAGAFYDDARRAGCYESEAAYRADGLVSLADDAVLGRGTGMAKPTVILRVDLAALHRGELDGDGAAQCDGGPGEMCEIAGVGPVSLATATRVLGDAYVKLVISDGIDIRTVCHVGRTIPASLKTALEQRDPVCSVPRCDNRYSLESHHLVAVTDGGPTSLDNLVRICKWHHDLITYERWRLRGGPGEWTWHPPPDFDGVGPAP